MVYADSVTPVSADGFKFSGSLDYPDALKGFEKSFAFLESVPCDVLITAHPEISGLWDRLAARKPGATTDPMVDAGACRQLAKHGREQLRQRLADESKPQR